MRLVIIVRMIVWKHPTVNVTPQNDKGQQTCSRKGAASFSTVRLKPR